MGLVPAKAFVVVQLSLLLLSCFTVYGEESPIPPHPPVQAPSHPPKQSPSHPPSHHHHHHRGHPPSHPPIHPPSHPPMHPPSHPPMHPPSHPPMHPPSHPPMHPPSHPPMHPPMHHHPHPHPPSHPPMHPPSHPPMHPPSHSPIPRLPPRSLVAVEGVVYCKSCKYTGVETLLGASPLLGAVVRFQCNNTKYPLVQETQTDKNGYFFIQAPKKITTYGAHKCKVSLVSSPLGSCNKPTDLHAGLKGAMLMFKKPPTSPPLPFVLFTVGPFAFESSSTVKCPP